MVQVEHISGDQDISLHGSHLLLVRQKDLHSRTETTVTMSGQVIHSAHGSTVITPQALGAELAPALRLAEGFAERLYIPVIYVRDET